MEDLKFVAVETQDQIELVAELAKEIWYNHYTQFLTLDQVDYMVETYQTAQAMASDIAKGTCYYLLELTANNVGYMAIKFNEDHLFLSKLYILSDYRGKGLASKSMNFILQQAKNKDYSKIKLVCNSHNKNTLEVYKRFGFTLIESLKNDVGAGYFMDDSLLEKTI